MTQEQARATADTIAALWAVPISAENDTHNLQAVLNVDDSRPLDGSPLGLGFAGVPCFTYNPLTSPQGGLSSSWWYP